MGLLGRAKRWIEMKAGAKRVAKDPWLMEMLLYINDLFTNPENKGEHPYLEFLQDKATQDFKAALGQEISSELTRICEAKDRVIACREWIVRIVDNYAPIHVLFMDKDDWAEHLCGGGLMPYINDVIKVSFDKVRSGETHLISALESYEHDRMSGNVEECGEILRARSLRDNLLLKIANFGRILLGDVIKDQKDWFLPYCLAACANWEMIYRGNLGLPYDCDAPNVIIEHNSIRENILRGNKNPLENVEFAKPQK
jgi:hypothetical protein